MTYKCGDYRLIEKKSVSAGIYSFVILCPDVADIARCGQFVHIRVDGFTLRRPISICEIDRERGTIRIVFEVRGSGTDKLSELNTGDNVDMIAPLGNGFTIKPAEEGKHVIVVGGGIGVPPMLETAKAAKNAIAVLGFRSFDRVILTDDFKAAGIGTIVCTDDGSVGVAGTIEKSLCSALDKGGISAVYACGPKPMLGTVISAAKKHGVFCEVSLEERMGCGVGACVGCVCRVNRNGEEKLLRVCKDGPVFNGEEVIL